MSSFKSTIAGLTLTAIATFSHAQSADALRIIVKYKNQQSMISAVQQIQQLTGLPVESSKPMAGGAVMIELKTKNKAIKSLQAEEERILQKLRHHPAVKYAVKDRVGHVKPLPDIQNEDHVNLLDHSNQWDEFKAPAGVRLESAAWKNDEAWAITRGHSTPNTVVAVLDTGIDANDSIVNSLVKGNDGQIWGWNFSANDDNIFSEGSYHGTHVSGTIAAYGQVAVGMGDGLKVLPVKIPDASGMFYESAVINGIYWAAGADVPGAPKNLHPARVINMSFGVDERPGKEVEFCDEALQEAVDYARNRGVVLVVAAGNDNRWEQFNAPASCNGTIKVASTGPTALRSYFSNYGPSISFAAPGGDKRYGTAGGILSTVNPGGGYLQSGFDFYQGTSMASPHVAGVAGLVLAVNPDLSAREVEKLLYVTTHDFAYSDNDNDSCRGSKPCGHGILDAKNAVDAAMAQYDVLFSAPNLQERSYFNSTIEGAQGERWVVSGEKNIDKGIQPARIYSNEKGEIFASYGAVNYRLDASRFKQCKVIGYDGVGCYR